VVTTPDLISVVEAETGAPVTADSPYYGQRLMTLAYPCHPKWRTPGGIALVRPSPVPDGLPLIDASGKRAEGAVRRMRPRSRGGICLRSHLAERQEELGW
jgi:hypothetical protein